MLLFFLLVMMFFFVNELIKMEKILTDLNENLNNVNKLISKLNDCLVLSDTKVNTINTDLTNYIIKGKYPIKLAVNFDYDEVNLMDTGLTAIIYNFETDKNQLDKYGYYKLNDDETNAIKNIKIPETYLINGETLTEGETEYRFKYFDPYSVNKPGDNDYIIIKTITIQNYTVEELNKITNLTERWEINNGSLLDTNILNNNCTFPSSDDNGFYNYIQFVPTGGKIEDNIWKPSRKYWPVLYEQRLIKNDNNETFTNGILPFVYICYTSITSMDISDSYVQTNRLMNEIFNNSMFYISPLTTLNNIEKIIDSDDLKTNMNCMFYDCYKLNNNTSALAALSNWDISNATDMSYMFYSCNSSPDISVLSNWNVSNVTNMNQMFVNYTSISTMYLNNWNVSNVTDMSSMFYSCGMLSTLYLNNWIFNDDVDTTNMFKNCSKLTTVYIMIPNDILLNALNDTSGGSWSYDGNKNAYVKS